MVQHQISVSNRSSPGHSRNQPDMSHVLDSYEITPVFSKPTAQQTSIKFFNTKLEQPILVSCHVNAI